ncbi:MAG: hypothetical protein P4M11_12590 [Candidatus Pacebacteria bacterium]|nr:hypothetical protein [Candidatus Paceibacterota bacterium]
MAGSVTPSYIGVRAFPPSLTEDNHGKTYVAIDIIRLIFSAYFIVCLFLSIVIRIRLSVGLVQSEGPTLLRLLPLRCDWLPDDPGGADSDHRADVQVL